jgi:hypothetical protein
VPSIVAEEYDVEEEITDIVAEPSLDFTRKTWWDSLLSLYASPFSRSLVVLAQSERESAAREIKLDLQWLFRISNYWFSFFHFPTFFSTFDDPVRRAEMQPSLVLSLLAVSTFWKSSDFFGKGQEGRKRAMRFRDVAQGLLEASFNARWLDESLAQAAWVIPALCRVLFSVLLQPTDFTSFLAACDV